MLEPPRRLHGFVRRYSSYSGPSKLRTPGVSVSLHERQQVTSRPGLASLDVIAIQRTLVSQKELAVGDSW